MSQSLNHHQATETGCWCQRTFFTSCQSLHPKRVWVSRLFSSIFLALYQGDIVDSQPGTRLLLRTWKRPGTLPGETELDVIVGHVPSASCLLSPNFLGRSSTTSFKTTKFSKAKFKTQANFYLPVPHRSSAWATFQTSQSKKLVSLFYFISYIGFSKRRESK